MSTFDCDENAVTAEDAASAALSAIEAARLSGSTRMLSASERAGKATEHALKDNTDGAHEYAIYVHNTAWKLYRAATIPILSEEKRRLFVVAFNHHERAILFHGALRNRIIRGNQTGS